MREIQEAVRARLEEAAGAEAVSGRAAYRAYPLLAVDVREDGTVLIDGGRQAEHSYLVTITAAADRERNGNTALTSALAPVLLQGIPMGDRVLHPLNIKTVGNVLSFSVTLCVPLPAWRQPEETETGTMERLYLSVGRNGPSPVNKQ